MTMLRSAPMGKHPLDSKGVLESNLIELFYLTPELFSSKADMTRTKTVSN
jgi:hypothetical protein